MSLERDQILHHYNVLSKLLAEEPYSTAEGLRWLLDIQTNSNMVLPEKISKHFSSIQTLLQDKNLYIKNLTYIAITRAILKNKKEENAAKIFDNYVRKSYLNDNENFKHTLFLNSILLFSEEGFLSICNSIRNADIFSLHFEHNCLHILTDN